MAQAYLATMLPGKEHLARLPDGGLLCRDVIIARSGPLDYTAHELDIPPGGDARVTVWRPPEEVKSRRFLASIEGATVTDMHPSRFVDPQTYQIFARGHAQNARVGPTDKNGHVTALADLFIHDDGLAQKVESGQVRDVSIGYNLDIVRDEIGRWSQVNLRVNHVAVVPKGRAGSTRIMDAAPSPGLTELAAQYLGKDIATVQLPTRAFDSSREETVMENYEEDLLPVEQPQRNTGRDEALRALKQIKPQVQRQGTDAQKRAWNALYVAVRDGHPPDLVLREMQLSSGGRIAVSDHASYDAGAEFVRAATAYLGRDIKEVEEEKRKSPRPLRTAEQLRHAIFDSPAETPMEGFLRKVEDERRRQEKLFGY
jgi:hypothetical protein